MSPEILTGLLVGMVLGLGFIAGLIFPRK